MKLIEVVYTKCKVCSTKIGKGGRDHRFGVCDKHVYEGTVRTEKKDIIADLEQEVRDMLWDEYRQDPFTAVPQEYPEQMNDGDFMDFEQHVRDVVTFARAHRIRNPQMAINAYTDEIRNKQLHFVRH